MKNIALTITFSLFIALFSCKKEEKEIEHDYLETTIKKFNVKNNIKWVIVLPGLGCQGCIQEGEAFMKENISNKDALFILTKIESFKILQNKLDIKLNDHPNVIIDKKNDFQFPTDNGVYPCIIMLNNGEIKGHTFQSPKNGTAFENLKKQIEMKL